MNFPRFSFRPMSSPPRTLMASAAPPAGRWSDWLSLARSRRPWSRLTFGAGGVDAAQFLALTAQLALVLLAAYQFRVEETYGLPRVLPIVFFGFVVHACLPLRLRLPFFLLLSLGAMTAIFRPLHIAALLSIGLGLIAICHLPFSRAVRGALLVAAGAVLAALRAELLPAPFRSLPEIVLPMIGSIFMFRLIIYFYDLGHEKKPASLWERLSYFFLLPNFVFPFFPVVDYQTFRRTYYDSAPLEIYQKGVLWMLRGVTHLLLYRLVYFFLVPAPEEVQGLGGVVQFMLATYLLYLRISGQFHLIVGILCLFGFNLPETHHRYFLATGFNDYWRRINIYWKDFMTKIFYYPAFMRLRRLGMTTAMVLATVLVFFATWLLHSYQWFWLRGTFPVTGPDALFWGILGALVVVNSLYEARRGRKRSLRAREWTLRESLGRALKTLGMFVALCVLWSLWSSASLGEWAALLARAGDSGAGAYGALLLAMAAVVAAVVALQYAAHWGWGLRPAEGGSWRVRPALTTGLPALLLVLAGLPAVYTRLGEEVSSVMTTVQENGLNQRDAQLVERGYYEGLLDMDTYTASLDLQASAPRVWKTAREEGATRDTHDILEYELLPSFSGTVMRAAFHTNRWGMRDKDYELRKPPRTYRIALVGSSYSMGSGVADDQTFEALLEERLNRENTREAYDRYEVLNFSVFGYGVARNLAVMERKVFEFEPDAVLYVGHAYERQRFNGNFIDSIRQGHSIDYPYLQDVIRRSGIEQGMSRPEMARRLEPFLDEAIRWGYRQMAEVCRTRGITPVWVFVPGTVNRALDEQRYPQLASAAS